MPVYQGKHFEYSKSGRAAHKRAKAADKKPKPVRKSAAKKTGKRNR